MRPIVPAVVILAVLASTVSADGQVPRTNGREPLVVLRQYEWFGDAIDVFHDADHGATCWVLENHGQTSASLSCLPDSQLRRAQ